MNQSHVGAFLKLHAESAHPDTQIHFWPVLFNAWEIPYDRFGFRVGVGPLRPTSRGEVRLRSSGPNEYPLLFFNYCTTHEDLTAMRECVELARGIAMHPAFSTFKSTEIDPGPQVRTETQIDAWIRETATTSWHPIGTCVMGDPQAEMTVVDPHTRVKDVPGLRVVDASIMPSMVSSNPNAVVMMMAERASDLILDRPPVDTGFFVE